MNHATYKLNVERVRLERLRRKIDKQLIQINRAIQLLEYDAVPIDNILNPPNGEDEVCLDLGELDLVLPECHYDSPEASGLTIDGLATNHAMSGERRF